MTKNEFKAHVQDKIKELIDMPSHGDECDGAVFDHSEFLGCIADVVRDIYQRAAQFGFVQKQPAKLMSRDEALYCLRQVASFLAAQQHVARRGVVQSKANGSIWKQPLSIFPTANRFSQAGRTGSQGAGQPEVLPTRGRWKDPLSPRMAR